MIDIEKICRFEAGEMGEEEMVELFQDLIDTNVVWTLQGSYGRMAAYFIQEGLCHPRKDFN